MIYNEALDYNHSVVAYNGDITMSVAGEITQAFGSPYSLTDADDDAHSVAVALS